MNFAEVKKLVKLVESSEIQELEIEQDGAKIRITKPEAHIQQVVATQIAAPASVVTPVSAPAAELAPANVAPAVETKSNYHEVKSPMVGTFYAAPAPDADPYIQVGDKVKNNQVLCIVEAMKLMNEIEADVPGRIVEILVENAQPVEFGQVLFLIDPNG